MKDPQSFSVVDFLKTHSPGKKVSIFQKGENVDGNMTKDLLTELKQNYQMLEMKEDMDQINCVKIDCELHNLGITTAFVTWSMRKLIKQIEDILDKDI